MFSGGSAILIWLPVVSFANNGAMSSVLPLFFIFSRNHLLFRPACHGFSTRYMHCTCEYRCHQILGETRWGLFIQIFFCIRSDELSRFSYCLRILPWVARYTKVCLENEYSTLCPPFPQMTYVPKLLSKSLCILYICASHIPSFMFSWSHSPFITGSAKFERRWVLSEWRKVFHKFKENAELFASSAIFCWFDSSSQTMLSEFFLSRPPLHSNLFHTSINVESI